VFNELDTDGLGFVNYNDIVEMISGHSLLQNFVGQSQYTPTQKGVSFQEVLERLCPGATASQLKSLEQWALEYDNESNRSKIAALSKRRMTQNTINGIKRLFDLYDINQDGYLDLREVKEAFKNLVDEAHAESIFPNKEESLDKRIDIQEFIRLLFKINSEFNEHIKKNYGINVA
jgi:Ca2+-binding EF-hand superfamily protein